MYCHVCLLKELRMLLVTASCAHPSQLEERSHDFEVGSSIAKLLYPAGHHLLACILGATSLYTGGFCSRLQYLPFLQFILIIFLIHIHFFLVILPQSSL